MGRKLTAIVVLTVVVAAGLRAQSTEPAVTPPTEAASQPATQHDAAFFDTLITHLQLAAEAQRDLRAATSADRPRLQKLADAATDADVRKQLLARIAEIDEENVTNPPLISVDLNDASFFDVADALQKALNVPIDTWPPRNQAAFGRFNNGGRYTLSAKERPFWEIFAQLNEQHPLSLETYNGLRLQPGGGIGLKRFVPASRAFAVFPMNIVRNRSINPQLPDGKPSESLSFQYIIAADPRLKILRHWNAVVSEIKDDLGNDLLQHDGSSSTYYGPQHSCLYHENTPLKIIPNMGTRIASFKAESRFLVEIARKTITVIPKDNLNKPFKVAGHTVTFTEFRPEGNTIHFGIRSDDTGEDSSRIEVSFVDATDKRIWSSQISGGISGGVGGTFQEPIKATFSVATKTTTLTIPFELKDLPLP